MSCRCSVQGLLPERATASNTRLLNKSANPAPRPGIPGRAQTHAFKQGGVLHGQQHHFAQLPHHIVCHREAKFVAENVTGQGDAIGIDQQHHFAQLAHHVVCGAQTGEGCSPKTATAQDCCACCPAASNKQNKHVLGHAVRV